MVFTNQLFEEQVKMMKLDYYTTKFTTESFLKLLLFAQLEEVESLHARWAIVFEGGSEVASASCVYGKKNFLS